MSFTFTDIAAFGGLIAALLSLYLNFLTRRDVTLRAKIDKVTETIMAIFRHGNSALHSTGEEAETHIRLASVSYRDLYAYLRDDLSLGSLLADAEIKSNLMLFYRLCVDDSLAKISHQEALTSGKMEEMEKARYSLIQSVRTVAKKIVR